MSASEQSESIGAKVSPELKQKIRIRAAQEGMTMSEYIRSVLAETVENDPAE